jgi:hypothetical protein
LHWQAGYMCPLGSTNATAVPCDAGQFSTGSVGQCTACPKGSFANATGQSSCGVCAIGQFSATGAPLCADCPAGWCGPGPNYSLRVRVPGNVATLTTCTSHFGPEPCDHLRPQVGHACCCCPCFGCARCRQVHLGDKFIFMHRLPGRFVLSVALALLCFQDALIA